MIQIFLIRFLAISVLILSPAIASACADGPDTYAVRGVYSDDHLNVRSGPSLDYSVIVELPHNATNLQNLDRVPVHLCSSDEHLTPFEKRNIWVKIKWDNGGKLIFGWVKARYLGEG